jgi:hypothetical protein
MSDLSPAAYGAHLVGSVVGPNARAVFETVGPILGDRLRTIPDGETGKRKHWAEFQFDVFDQLEQLEPALGAPHHPHFAHSFRLRPGVDAGAVTFGSTGYVEAALDSYETFLQCRESGVLAPHVKFPVSLPTPMTPIRMFAAPDAQLALEPRYWAAMTRDLQELCRSIPAADLAIQWDTAESGHHLI